MPPAPARERSIETLTHELVTDVAGLLVQPVRRLGHTEWAEMTQEQVSAFAELTGDRNFIHVDPERAAAEVLEAGRLDIMVTNAGVLRDRVLWKMTGEDVDVVIETYLRGTFTCARAAAVRMREQGDGGRIVVVGSPAGQFGNVGQTNDAAAEAGNVAFAQTWSIDLARSEITVNAVIPTAWTQMTATIPVYAPLAESVQTGEPLPAAARRDHALGMPEDCAPLVVFLASAAGAAVTGQAIGIGGDKLTLYSHPAELAVRFRDGGWTAEQIAERWNEQLAAQRQPSGIELPPLDLASEAAEAAR